MTNPPRRGWVLALAACAQLGARADLVVLRSPDAPELVNYSAPFCRHFYPNSDRTDYSFDADVVAIKTSDIDWTGCKLRYTGDEDLEGKVAIWVQPLSYKCGTTTILRYGRTWGLAGQLTYYPDVINTGLRHISVGYWRNVWRTRAPRADDPYVGPSGEFTARASIPIVEALLAGQKIRARMARTEVLWEAFEHGALFALWRAFIILLAAFCIEMAATRLYAFIKQDGGKVHLTVPNLVMMGSIVANTVRILYIGLGPIFTTPTLSVPASNAMMVLSASTEYWTSAVFVGYVWLGLAKGGLAQPNLQRVTARTLLAIVTCAFVVDILGATMYMFVYGLYQAMTANSCVFPGLIAIFCIRADMKLQKLAGHLPSVPLMKRIRFKLRASILLSLAFVPVPPLTFILMFNPYTVVLIFTYGMCVLTATSLVQMTTFWPTATKVPRGPLLYCLETLAGRRIFTSLIGPNSALPVNEIEPATEEQKAAEEASRVPAQFIEITRL